MQHTLGNAEVINMFHKLPLETRMISTYKMSSREYFRYRYHIRIYSNWKDPGDGQHRRDIVEKNRSRVTGNMYYLLRT